MNIARSHLTVFTVFFALFIPTALQAQDEWKKRDFELGSKLYPKHFHWQKEIKGETVVMDIDAEYFVPAKHKMRDGKVDGYQALPGYSTGWGSKFPYFTIVNWTIRWGHKRLQPFPRGVYTSVFTPALRDLEPDPRTHGEVGVFICDGSDALMATMGFGQDGVTGTVVFVITKDGRIRRFITLVSS